MPADKDRITALLTRWAERTRRGEQDLVLSDHDTGAVIYDVLAPLQYHGTVAYRASWDAWQPQTEGEAMFRLEDLQVVADDGVGFAHGLIRCGGTLADGRRFEDLVRATFCLTCGEDGWKIAHQHISVPRG